MSDFEPCMGGWCTKREKCPHHQTESRRNPAERLCPPGRDGEQLRQLVADPRFAGLAFLVPAVEGEPA